MKTDDELRNIVNAILNEDYSNTTYTSQLYEMFSKDDKAIKAYIKEGREFWHFNGSKYRKLKVTYVRSGVMFFVFEDEPDVEQAWFISSFNACSLYAAQIYPYEIGKFLAERFEGADENFPKICKQCKWDDCGGKISVEVIWDSDAKEKAKEAYPVLFSERNGLDNYMADRRVAYENGYEQAKKDMIQKAVEWLVLNTQTLHFTYETPRCFKKSFDESLEDLKKYMND